MALAKGGASFETSAAAGRKRELSLLSSSAEPPAAGSHSPQTGPSLRQGRTPVAGGRGSGRLQQDDSTDEDDGDLESVPVLKPRLDSNVRPGRSSAPSPSYTSRLRDPTQDEFESRASRPSAPAKGEHHAVAHRAGATAPPSSANEPAQRRLTDQNGGYDDDDDSGDDIFTSLRKRKLLERPAGLSVKRDKKSDSGKGDSSSDIIPLFF